MIQIEFFQRKKTNFVVQISQLAGIWSQLMLQNWLRLIMCMMCVCVYDICWSFLAESEEKN